ncbi:MAG: four helix bundle protein [Candidatus Saccharimonas aalborgensis]
MNELPAILRTQELYLALMPVTEKLAGLERQTLGRRAEDAVLTVLELLIMAKHAPKAHKAVYLLKASAQLELLQFHLRIVLEKKLANATTTHQLQAKVSEIGRMTGGWLKSVQ